MYFLVSGNTPQFYPAETFFGLICFSENEAVEIPYQYPLLGEWGSPISSIFNEPNNFPTPTRLDLVYLSIIEGCFYSLESSISVDRFNKCWEVIYSTINNDELPYVITGLAPYGMVALWIMNSKKSFLIGYYKAKMIQVEMKDFRPSFPQVSLNDICKRYIETYPSVKDNLENNGLPPCDLFDNYMKQFTYRYQVDFRHWEEENKEWKSDNQSTRKEENLKSEAEFDYIEEALFDGTHDKLHDGGLMNYHQAGKPKKLAIKWHVKKSEYTAYFWFEDEGIHSVFDKFYGVHPEIKVDLLIRIDPEKNKYELSLYRCGLREPQVISENVYQLLVFKNKFERFRSDNYNQERGAWIW